MPNTPQQQPEETLVGEYKPNIYPIIYWALLYGLLAGVVLVILRLLAQFITLVWLPVFLAGAGWGAYRNYRKQKDEWMNAQGVAPMKKSAMEEFKDAARDIASASRTMIAEQAEEDRIAEEQALAEEGVYEEAAYEEQEQYEEELPQQQEEVQPVPTPQPPVQPQQPPQQVPPQPTPPPQPPAPQPPAPTPENDPRNQSLPNQ